MAGPFTFDQVLQKKRLAKAQGPDITVSSNTNIIIDIVNEGHHGAINWDGTVPDNSGPAVIVTCVYADGTLAKCNIPVGKQLGPADTVTCPPRSEVHGEAAVIIVFADSSIVSLTSGQSYNGSAKKIVYNIDASDVEKQPNALDEIKKLNYKSMKFELKRLNRTPNLQINGPLIHIGIRG